MMSSLGKNSERGPSRQLINLVWWVTAIVLIVVSIAAYLYAARLIR